MKLHLRKALLHSSRRAAHLSKKFLVIGSALNIRFSKVVSYGNTIDLDCPDFLDYLLNDPKTKIVALYIEGTKKMGGA
jgi:acyl-CoA synthetase (NDP forming)